LHDKRDRALLFQIVGAESKRFYLFSDIGRLCAVPKIAARWFRAKTQKNDSFGAKLCLQINAFCDFAREIRENSCRHGRTCSGHLDSRGKAFAD
jgi:hypothetical protein